MQTSTLKISNVNSWTETFQKRASKSYRSQLINQKRRKKKNDQIRCIFTFNEGNPPLHQFLRQGKKAW